MTHGHVEKETRRPVPSRESENGEVGTFWGEAPKGKWSLPHSCQLDWREISLPLTWKLSEFPPK